jgi:acetyl-CoA carboxylase biotin carboxyl carrier protein
MNITEIKELIQAVVESGVAELEVQRAENRVRIVRGGSTQEVILAPGTVQMAAAPAIASEPVPAIAAPVAAAATAPAAAAENTVAIKSPIVGTFYGSPSPGSPAFVNVGDVVKPGQVVCIIESMKLMNEIECEVSGTITACHVENGSPVEYGAALYSVRPH